MSGMVMKTAIVLLQPFICLRQYYKEQTDGRQDTKRNAQMET